MIDARYQAVIEAALQYSGGTHTFEDIQAGVEKGSLQFWSGPASAVITEIVTFPRTKALNFFLAGGSLAELRAMYPVLLQWGKDQGCTTAVFTGRPGWERTFLKDEGWKPTLTVFEKEL